MSALYVPAYTCTRCGCTESRPCAGGCGWANVEKTLCSRCVEDPPRFDFTTLRTLCLGRRRKDARSITLSRDVVLQLLELAAVGAHRAGPFVELPADAGETILVDPLEVGALDAGRQSGHTFVLLRAGGKLHAIGRPHAIARLLGRRVILPAAPPAAQEPAVQPPTEGSKAR